MDVVATKAKPRQEQKSQNKNLSGAVLLHSRQLVVSIPSLSAPSCHLLGKRNTLGTFFSKTAVFTVKIADHSGNDARLADKYVPIVFILPGRWQDGAGSLRIETICSLWLLRMADLLARPH